MAWCAGCLWEIPPTILSDSSVVCSAFTPPFNIGAACLAPRTRWYNKKLNKKPIQPWLDVLSRHQLNVCMCMNLPTVEWDGKALSAQNLTSSWLFFFFLQMSPRAPTCSYPRLCVSAQKQDSTSFVCSALHSLQVYQCTLWKNLSSLLAGWGPKLLSTFWCYCLPDSIQTCIQHLLEITYCVLIWNHNSAGDNVL